MDSGFAGLNSGIKCEIIESTNERINAFNRVISQLLPGLVRQTTCLTYRVICPQLTRVEHLSSLAKLVPQLCDENSRLKSCIQISGSITIPGVLPVQGRLVRESSTELLSDRLHRRSKQIRLRVRNNYLVDEACLIKETFELHYRLKPQLTPSTLVVSFNPDIFDTKLSIDETGLFSYMAIQSNPDRASIDYVYATQTLSCPGLLVPIDLVGLLLLALAQQKMPERQVESFEYHVYGQLYTRQVIRLCATALGERQILVWAEIDGNLVYRGVINLR
jgi:hydroxyacyl-ACP dehydratase HTD2-like protein with hotdog domain